MIKCPVSISIALFISTLCFAGTSQDDGSISPMLLGQPNGVATLDATGKVPASQIPGGGGGGSVIDVTATAPLSSTGGVAPDISIPLATNAVSGYLSAADHATFAAKQSALSFTAPLVNTLGTVTCNVASGTGAGCLSAVDWSTFNGKQDALGFTPENVANKDTDGTLSANSDTKYPSQKAVKTYADTKQPAFTPGDISTSTSGVTVGAGANSTVGPDVTVDIDTASGSQPGLLSAADWTTFNDKEDAVTATTSADYYRGDKTFQTLNTAAVPELTNLYYTQGRFDAAFAAKDTADLAEGSNLYFTDARAIAAPITGFTSGAGAVAATDSVLQAIQKLDGNATAGLGTKWSLGGNAGTSAGTDIFGTTDAEDLQIRTNNLTRILVKETGELGIGNGSPVAKVDVRNETTGTVSALQGMSSVVSAGSGSTVTSALALNLSTEIDPASTTTSAAGASISVGGEAATINGIYVNLGSASQTDGRAPTGLTIINGKKNITVTDPIPSSAFLASTSLDTVSNTVPSGSPVTGTSFISKNIGADLLADDDFANGPVGFGWVGSFLGGSVAVDSGKTVADANFLAITPLISAGSGGGTVTDFSYLRAVPPVNQGGTLTITNLYGIKVDSSFGAASTNTWGFYINDTGSENFLHKLAIGTSSKKVANSSTALEIGNSKGFVNGRGDEATRDALTAVAGMQFYNTDTDVLEWYDGSSWIPAMAGAGAVTSVNGASGVVVLDTDDISEGATNLYYTDARVIAAPLTGFSASAGTVASSDTVLQGFNKVVGNIAAKQDAKLSVADGGNTAYTILAADNLVRAGTTLTADRTYTLPACAGGNIGEVHEIKNPPAQTFNIILAADGSDLIDGSASKTLLPGDSYSVICGAAAVWDIR